MLVLKERIQVSRKQNRDLLILCSIGFLLTQKFGPVGHWWFPALLCVISAFFFPKFITPVTYLWLLIGDLIGTIVTKVILSFVYFLVLIPMSFFKRKELRNKFGFKIDGTSEGTYFEFTDRSAYSYKDIENPY